MLLAGFKSGLRHHLPQVTADQVLPFMSPQTGEDFVVRQQVSFPVYQKNRRGQGIQDRRELAFPRMGLAFGLLALAHFAVQSTVLRLQVERQVIGVVQGAHESDKNGYGTAKDQHVVNKHIHNGKSLEEGVGRFPENRVEDVEGLQHKQDGAGREHPPVRGPADTHAPREGKHSINQDQ